MSPEEMLGKDVDRRSDLFSLGVLLFHLLTGEYPFSCQNLMRLMRAVTQEAPERPTRYNPDVSNRLENLVLRLLEKEPYLRPSNAGEVGEFLARTPFVRAQDVPAPAAAGWGFGRKMSFIRLLHHEKSVLERFLKDHAIDGVVLQSMAVRDRTVLATPLPAAPSPRGTLRAPSAPRPCGGAGNRRRPSP